MSAPPKSDPQRDNVYWFEAEINGWWCFSSATTKELQSLLIMICKYYGVDVPRFRVIRNRESSDAGWWDHDRDEIVLNRYREGANAGVLVHETAHYLVDCFYTDVESHGPEFVAIYMHLLDNYRLLPNKCFRLLAKRYRLRIGRKYRPIAFR